VALGMPRGEVACGGAGGEGEVVARRDGGCHAVLRGEDLGAVTVDGEARVTDGAG
jgi:hypothetical protein